LPPLAARGQQSSVPTIGILVPAGEQDERGTSLFRQGLRELGYVEGRDILIEIRSAEGDLPRLPGLAADLVNRNVDLIVPFSTPAVLAAKQATSKIPIVMIAADPVGVGIVASLARPGGNITGISAVNAELGAKLVELLNEALPDLHRIAVLLDAADAFSKPLLNHVQLAGQTGKIEIVPFWVAANRELDAAFAALAGRQIEAVIVQGSLPMKQSADLAIRQWLPAGAPRKIFAQNGGLLAYNQNGTASMRAMAILADKVLRGAKPADLPVEQPTRFELTINLATAKALGLTVPQSLLARADEVIE
jgi:putative ABC transport system substrate-binding protein